MADVLLSETADGVSTLTLNRPESMNSLSAELKQALVSELQRIAADPSVRAVVLTGTGRGFCVGQDLAEHAELLQADDPAPLSTVREHYNPITLALTQMPKPVVAAVNGTAAGAGASFAFACDFRIVAESAKFLLAFANVGLGLDSGVSWTLPRLIGAGRALELALLAQPITATELNSYGAVNELVPAAEVLPRAQALAARLAAGPTVAYAAIKQAIHFAGSHDLSDSLENEAVQQAVAGASQDHRSAVAAFVAKQQPSFTGR
ncbi:enoyl-CoA hydratase-related protein [Jatrophihabitans telluris]|uniref:Enoyl-CoA hydratase-related protein n=1 Tax=Jatrophihabitans telluris TaxID=2038343 RepID=A0ABY4QWH9_9ACTN|nr:enoyl-CoA hydratase-related protein [Jatrophihabitans telluris]UQX87703.1 enoyl-CoA hydratase-related protein [Jatrophihabitans telluris]